MLGGGGSPDHNYKEKFYATSMMRFICLWQSKPRCLCRKSPGNLQVNSILMQESKDLNPAKSALNITWIATKASSFCGALLSRRLEMPPYLHSQEAMLKSQFAFFWKTSRAAASPPWPLRKCWVDRLTIKKRTKKNHGFLPIHNNAL